MNAYVQEGVCLFLDLKELALKQFNQDTLEGLSSWLASIAIRRRWTFV